MNELPFHPMYNCVSLWTLARLARVPNSKLLYGFIFLEIQRVMLPLNVTTILIGQCARDIFANFNLCQEMLTMYYVDI